MSSDLVNLERTGKFGERYGMEFARIAKRHTMSGIAQDMTAREVRTIRSGKLPLTLPVLKRALITVSEKYFSHNFVASKPAYFISRYFKQRKRWQASE